jgi:ATP phosphoribosyltransferase regulatory subunit
MEKNKLITPEGTKDYLFEEAAVRKNVENKLRDSFHFRGYHEVVTPSLEFLDVFTTKENSIPVEQMYKLVDSKGRLMVLRPDSTMPIARLCATRLKNESLPIRLYYNQSVFSVNKSLRGRSDEIVQTGVELIGISNQKSDIEVLVTALNALKKLEIDQFRMEIGHIGIFNSLISSLEISADQKETIRFLIQSKNYPALNDMLNSIAPCEAVSVLKMLPRLFGGYEVFDKMEQVTTDPHILSVLNYLKKIYKALQQLGMEDYITLDLGIVNRTDYYTGIVFKGYVEGYGEEVLSGGRYDSLLQEFGENIGAIGFGINVDSAVNALMSVKEHKTLPVEVLVYSELENQMDALAYIESLSEQQIVSEYSLMDSLDESVLYAKQKGIHRIDIVSDKIKTITL